ncbi:saccharopine dehydrogenase family protein [Paraconexibacter algicola]|uniref:Enoyl-ACP reductase n=1 Tax=Paraconexibacter algicola TaxID=2133960 RepID=A0A2T4UDW8_9ACTN|nr:saccharopine dehydrogenase NADP-binding domain-containing protein [Paraconexibacter algicola]PTL55699.1 enoyl-ACP reductase [Paraconexibacter algicola]
MTDQAQDREHDVVVLGATGFVGRLTAAYLGTAAPEGTRIALGGRSREKLERTRAELGGRAADWPLVVADSLSDADMDRVAASTRVVATTVGPYAQYGLPLVRACAQHGTHYADLTGEVLFIRDAIDLHHEAARASGARIVHTCGFDSVPSDLGVHALHVHATRHGLGGLTDTTYVVKAAKGGVSGGTVASLRGQLDIAKADRTKRRIMVDPYGLSPDREAEPSDLGDERDPQGVVRDDALGGFLAPFFMGVINTRVVRRSNALLGYAYGRRLRYRELMLGGGLPLGPVKAGAIAGGLTALVVGLSLPPTRKLLDAVLPDPGEGPSEQDRENGFFAIDVHTTTSDGTRLVCAIRAPGDPGYKATAVMLGEAALSLALDGDALPPAAGVLTPATAMGTALTDRLRAAGHAYEVRAA